MSLKGVKFSATNTVKSWGTPPKMVPTCRTGFRRYTTGKLHNRFVKDVVEKKRMRADVGICFSCDFSLVLTRFYQIFSTGLESIRYYKYKLFWKNFARQNYLSLRPASLDIAHAGNWSLWRPASYLPYAEIFSEILTSNNIFAIILESR